MAIPLQQIINNLGLLFSPIVQSIRQQYPIVLSNAGSKAIFRRNQPIFSAEYWFDETAFDLLFCDEYNK